MCFRTLCGRQDAAFLRQKKREKFVLVISLLLAVFENSVVGSFHTSAMSGWVGTLSLISPYLKEEPEVLLQQQPSRHQGSCYPMPAACRRERLFSVPVLSISTEEVLQFLASASRVK